MAAKPGRGPPETLQEQPGAGADAKRAALQVAADEAHANLDAKSTAVNGAKEKLDESSAQLKDATEVQSKEELSKSDLFDSIDSASEKVELVKQVIPKKRL